MLVKKTIHREISVEAPCQVHNRSSEEILEGTPEEISRESLREIPKHSVLTIIFLDVWHIITHEEILEDLSEILETTLIEILVESLG